MTAQGGFFSSATGYRVFTFVKYLVYALLCVNVYLFLREESLALDHTFVSGLGPGQIIQAFAASIDTTAWVILLLLFELETSVLDDSRIKGGVRWFLHGVRGFCYIAVGYAFTGYYAELVTVLNVTPVTGTDFCGVLDRGYSLLVDIDEYEPLDAVNCMTLADTAFRINGFDILAAGDILQSVRNLCWTDVFNSAAWILVVIMLEIEVRLQLRGDLSDQIMSVTKVIKLALYATLFIAAAYWGYSGALLDFWDAALWLFAFIFIELNVFEWQSETSQEVTQGVLETTDNV